MFLIGFANPIFKEKIEGEDLVLIWSNTFMLSNEMRVTEPKKIASQRSITEKVSVSV